LELSLTNGIVVEHGPYRADVEIAEISALTVLPSYPNPFNPETKIAFGLHTNERVEIEIFDLRGRRVRRLLDEMRPAGWQVVSWNGRDGDDRPCAAGVYLATVRAESGQRTVRMTMVK
jgi:hypothetical protein